MKKYFALAFFAVSLLSCGPATEISQSWKDPGSTTTLNDYSKILVVVFAKDETTRRQAEEQFVANIKGKGVPSYSYKILVEKGSDANAAATALVADGFDCAMVTRLVDKEKETSYVPGTTTGYYGGFRGYYGYGYGAYYNPGYYVEDKIYTIETNVYDLKKDKLVWSAVSKTTNPGKISKELNIYADVLADQMRKDGFLKTAAK
ncbi:MAG TPA: hypothetical protein VLC98_01355 [Phnomibacter sp.]|nr:hypothetical protein [Phnomibacter sp.]